jgi:Rab3 GTPase-activating protein catalytic subunit
MSACHRGSEAAARSDILPVPDPEEMVDYTCATAWERLALDVELKLREWNLVGDSLDDRPMESKRTDAALGQREFCLHYLAEPDQNLERLLGVTCCILLEPHSNSSGVVGDASDAATLLSALTVAASACNCSLPLIVRVGSAKALRFIGRQCSALAQFRFSCDFLAYLPASHANLPGLLQLFHNKRVVARRLQPPSRTDALISAEFSYFWSDFLCEIAVPHDSFASDPTLTAFHRPLLAFGDPIPYLEISAIWLPFRASELTNEGRNGDMPFVTASSFRVSPPRQYTLNARSTSSGSILPLTAAVRSCLRLAQTADRVPGPAARFCFVKVQDSENGMCDSLNDSHDATPPNSHDKIERNIENSPSMPVVGSSNSKTIVRTSPDDIMDTFLLLAIERIAAAAAVDQGIDQEYLSSAIACLFDMDLSQGIDADVVDALGPGAMGLTIVQRLGKLIAGCRTLRAATMLWTLFVDCIELYWRRKWIVRGIPYSLESGPDQSETLLEQKLQMINCCLGRMTQVRKKEVDEFGRMSRIPGVSLLGPLSQEHINASPSNEAPRHVYKPVVQPLPFVTRDIVEAEQSKIMKNATSKEADCQNEARRQSNTLRSDMMSFKAANPGACMADFVRWFSPGDWLDSDDDALYSMPSLEAERSNSSQPNSSEASPSIDYSSASISRTVKLHDGGHLSARMCAPGNLWQEVWDSAEAIPATRQVPLFDPEMHGFKALDDMRLMSMSEVLRQLACVQAMYGIRILQNAFARPPEIPSMIAAISSARHSAQQSQNISLHSAQALGATSEACDLLATAEYMALGAASLIRKLPPASDFTSVLNALVSGNDITISGKQTGSALALVIGIDNESWRTPISPSYRSFVIEGSNQDRMHALLASDEFRIGFRLALDYSI